MGHGFVGMETKGALFVCLAYLQVAASVTKQQHAENCIGANHVKHIIVLCQARQMLRHQQGGKHSLCIYHKLASALVDALLGPALHSSCILAFRQLVLTDAHLIC